MTGALARVIGTTLALWLPLVPMYLFVRHAISSRSPSRLEPSPFMMLVSVHPLMHVLCITSSLSGAFAVLRRGPQCT